MWTRIHTACAQNEDKPAVLVLSLVLGYFQDVSMGTLKEMSITFVDVDIPGVVAIVAAEI